MTHRIRRVGVLRVGVISGMAYAALALVFVPFILFVSMVGVPMSEYGMGGGEWLFGPAIALLAPVLYGILGFIGGVVGALVYNLIAMMVGGLEIELEAVGAPDSAPLP